MFSAVTYKEMDDDHAEVVRVVAFGVDGLWFDLGARTRRLGILRNSFRAGCPGMGRAAGSFRSVRSSGLMLAANPELS